MSTAKLKAKNKKEGINPPPFYPTSRNKNKPQFKKDLTAHFLLSVPPHQKF